MSKKSSKKPVKKSAPKLAQAPAEIPKEELEKLAVIQSQMNAMINLALLAMGPHFKAFVILQRKDGVEGLCQGADFSFQDAERWLKEVTSKAPSA